MYVFIYGCETRAEEKKIKTDVLKWRRFRLMLRAINA